MTRKPRYDRDDFPPVTTREEFRKFRPAEEVLPPEVLAHLPKRRPGQRGPGKKPAKVVVAFRLDPDVAEAVRASGEGYGVRVNALLRAKFIGGERRRAAPRGR